MLRAIKSIIQRKKTLLETANLILEDFDNDEILDSITNDQIVGDQSDDDLRLDDDRPDTDSSNDDSSSSNDLDSTGDYTDDDEHEAIFAVTMDSRTREPLDLGSSEEIQEDVMDGFLDESVSKRKLGYYFFAGEGRKGFTESAYFGNSKNRLQNYYFAEEIGVDIGAPEPTTPEAPSPDSSSPDAPSDPNASPDAGTDSQPQPEETEMTTAVKDQLSGSDDENVTDASSYGMDSPMGGEGNDKTEKGKELLKIAKKLEDNIIEYFF